eukprot:104651_1
MSPSQSISTMNQSLRSNCSNHHHPNLKKKKANKNTNSMKTLHFSEMSVLNLYMEDHHYADIKSYTAADKGRFTRNAIGEAIQIKKLLLCNKSSSSSSSSSNNVATNNNNESKADSSKHHSKQSKQSPKKLPLAAHLEACGISQEMIVGLEHLILEDPKNVFNRRRNHARLVLLEQAYQKTEGRDDICRLAKLSSKLAKRPMFEARKRAARAA